MKRFVKFGSKVLVLWTMFAFAAAGQTATIVPASDPQAVGLVGQALLALGTAPVSDVTLSGSVTRSVGPDVETGTFTLKALGLAQSRMDLDLPSGPLTQIQTVGTNSRECFWVLASAVHAAANHNCAMDASWFFPRLSVLGVWGLNPNSVITLVGQEKRADRAVYHLHYFVQGPPSDASGLAQHLTSEEIYLDSSSLLLVALTFNEHPDDNAAIDIPVELDFSDYRAISGVNMPFRIQKTFNGNLLLDMTVQSAAFNTGLANADFAAQ